MQEHRAAYRKRYPERDRATRLAIHMSQRKKATNIVSNIKRRAKEKGLPFDLDKHVPEIQARIDIGLCELSGIPFVWGLRGRCALTASVDRIIPAKGYVYTNIRLICLALNVAFNNWGEEIAFRIFEAVKRKRATLDVIEPLNLVEEKCL
jgi:hypothetical protein